MGVPRFVLTVLMMSMAQAVIWALIPDNMCKFGRFRCRYPWLCSLKTRPKATTYSPSASLVNYEANFIPKATVRPILFCGMVYRTGRRRYWGGAITEILILTA